MKKYFRSLFMGVFFSLLSIMCAFANTNKQTSNLDLVIQGIPNNQGVVRIALYNSAELYKESDTTAAGSYKKVAVKINKMTAHYVFKNLPYGTYGIKVFHDQSNTGLLKTNILGMPLSAYGFSNNPNASLGMPSFKAIQFTVDKPHTKQVIVLKGPGVKKN